MNSFSYAHWLIVLVFIVALYAVPVFKILRQAGYSGWWTIVMFVPLLNFVMFYVFAFSRWPATRAAAAGTGEHP